MAVHGAKTVMILDDHPPARAGVLALLRANVRLEVAGAFGTSQQLLATMRAGPPDLVLLDYQLATDDCPGWKLLARLREDHAGTRVIVLSALEDEAHVCAALGEGACAFVEKSNAPEVLMRTLRKALREAAQPATAPPRAATPIRRHIKALSARERDVLRYCLEWHPCRVNEQAGKSRARAAAIAKRS